jgi:hypothetical protein
MVLGRLRVHGCAWYAPPCNSWSFLCRKQSERSRDDPFGDDAKMFVQRGNNQVLRVTLACLIAWLLGLDFVIETSLSSLIPCVPYVQELLSLSDASRHVCWLGFFGAPSPKPIKLLTTAPWIFKVFSRSVGSGRLCKSVVVNGKKRVSGIKDAVAQSKVYPEAFGKALVREMLEHRHAQARTAPAAQGPRQHDCASVLI